MAYIVPLISTKGSVGKTALVIHIAGYLASLGKRVLLIDADSQQSLSMYFRYEGLDPEISQNGFGKWLTGETPAEEVIRKTEYPNLHLIPNDDAEKWLVPKFLRRYAGSVQQLGNLLKPLREQYDYIFIDTEGTDQRDHDGRSVQNAVLLAEPDLVLSVTKTKMQFAMEVLRVVDVYHNAMREYEFMGKTCSPPALKFIINEHDRSLAMANEVLQSLRVSFASDPRFAGTTLLNTVVPFKRKFFEDEHHRNKIFMHEYRDPNQHDHLNVVIRELCAELFPELGGDTVKAGG